ncbi:alpha/beta hydrolase [Lentiprolixibacter aurantiacus]|uniref:Alpha/beta hydrolase n=1 Tax=Lentiprolixibacter aurantiacus TaxID=2993939 RepID=A0AAE3MNM4_9FLAO|nr:alpha/beta hydrolase [Lentiprolixibacter aurantiacus]MCX2720533.1 alpha/beta hydrolase [Lentiprolixibacter aurantiacus]
MNKSLLSACFLLMFALATQAQQGQLRIKKGIIVDSIQVQDTIPATFALYIPSTFEKSKPFPLLVVNNMNGEGREAISKFRSAAEKHQYLLAASNNLNDSLSISHNIALNKAVISSMAKIFRIPQNRIYVAGFGSGGKLAGITPVFLSGIGGVISIGTAVNTGLLQLPDRSRITFRLIEVVGREDYNYTRMLEHSRLLDPIKISNDLLVHDGGPDMISPIFVDRAVGRLSLDAMRKGLKVKDTSVINSLFMEDYKEFRQLMGLRHYVEAELVLSSMIDTYQTLVSIDSLVKRRRVLKRDRDYREQQREFSNLIFKENLMKSDFEYSLLQDLDALNYNNLGWWNFQMKKLKEYENKPGFRERESGKRLIAFLNALVEDNIYIELARPAVDEEALSLLWMIKTITDPTDFSYYLKIISDSAKYEDFGTAIFYLEELLKQGFTDKETLYVLENTALLRIMPEFNELVEKYLNEARYKINEE